jgi:hypothetical protein
VYADGAWKPAGEVGPDQVLLAADLGTVKAGQAKRLAGRVEVFDLTVDGPHTFFAGGFLVHNKDRPYLPALDDPWYILWPELLKKEGSAPKK